MVSSPLIAVYSCVKGKWPVYLVGAGLRVRVKLVTLKALTWRQIQHTVACCLRPKVLYLRRCVDAIKCTPFWFAGCGSWLTRGWLAVQRERDLAAAVKHL
jgi:hypothetical protein